MAVFSGAGVALTMKGAPTNGIILQAGEVYYPNSNQNPGVPGRGVGQAGWFYAQLGRYTKLQFLDPITQIWRSIGDDSNAERYFYADGANVRLANQSGCAVGAVVTTAGSAYTTAPTVTASAGSSKWLAILGPNVSTITVSYGGTNYVYPPAVIIDAPPVGGVQATGYATLSGTAVSTVTVTDQGGGYSGGVPNVTLVNDPRDTTGAGATATATMQGSGTVVAVLCTDHGNPITSGTIPTLTFGSGSAAATVVMNWGVSTISITTPGAGYGNSNFVWVTAIGPAATAAASNTAGVDIGANLVRQRKADIWVPTNATGGLSGTVQIIDGGVYDGIPVPIYLGNASPSTVAVVALTMGGFNDFCLIQPF